MTTTTESQLHETRTAFANALKLSMSLIAGIAVAVLVRILLPRYYGPEKFGVLSYAEAYAATFFTFTTFGLDTYIRKEVTTKLDHANTFYAGFFALRLFASFVIFLIMAAGLWLSGKKDGLVWGLVYIYGLGQIVYTDNYTLSSLLQATSQVTELSIVNVLMKILWCGLIATGLFFHDIPMLWIAFCFLLSEILKFFILMRIVHSKIHLSWSIDWPATWQVLKASTPYYLNHIALRIYEKLNIILLGTLAANQEVGWYNVSLSIAGFSLMFLPVMASVVMPMASRIAVKSIEAMDQLMRASARLTIVGGTLPALLVTLHADWLIGIMGKNYHESILSLKILSLMFPLTYLATIGSLHLIQHNRNYTLSKISALSVLLNPCFSIPLILWGNHIGAGYAGAMSAIATVLTEIVTIVINFKLLGDAAIDRLFWKSIGLTLFIALLVTVAHSYTLFLSFWQIPLEALLYLTLAVLFQIIPYKQLLLLLKRP